MCFEEPRVSSSRKVVVAIGVPREVYNHFMGSEGSRDRC
jgi:hypothetical protein